MAKLNNCKCKCKTLNKNHSAFTFGVCIATVILSCFSRPASTNELFREIMLSVSSNPTSLHQPSTFFLPELASTLHFSDFVYSKPYKTVLYSFLNSGVNFSTFVDPQRTTEGTAQSMPKSHDKFRPKHLICNII